MSSFIRHSQKSSDSVIYSQVLVLKILSVDWNRSSSIAIENVASLYHESVDYPMEAGSIVREAIDASKANLPKVLNSFRSVIAKKSEHNPP